MPAWSECEPTKGESALMTNHKSDCAVHNEPAMPAGPCDCGTGIVEAMARARHNAWAEEWSKLRPDEGRALWEDLSPECVEVSLRAERAALTAALDCMREPKWMSVMAYAICENMRAQERLQGIKDIRDKWPDDAEIHCDELAREAIDQLRKEALDE